MKLRIENGPVLYLCDFRDMDWEIPWILRNKKILYLPSTWKNFKRKNYILINSDISLLHNFERVLKSIHFCFGVKDILTSDKYTY